MLACLFAGATAVIAPITGDPQKIQRYIPAWLGPWAVQVLWSIGAVEALTVILFAVIFWRLTALPESLRSNAAVKRLLLLQVFLSAVLCENLIYVFAAQVAFLFPLRTGARWMGILVAAVAAATLGLVHVFPYFVPAAQVDIPRFALLAAATIENLAWCAFAYSNGHLVANEFRKRRELVRINAELRATQHLLAESSSVAERLHISRELHDVVGHHLTGLSVQLQLAARLSRDEAAPSIGKAHIIARVLLSDVRAVLSTLREERQIDLGSALRALAEGCESPRIHLQMVEHFSVEDARVANTLFRCAQETITNASRHARAGNLWLRVSRTEEGYTLTARDDGQGVDRVAKGRGLLGMEERLSGVAGTLEVITAPGRGFNVRAFIPIQVEGGPSALLVAS